jgi:uncharacterized protein GlcG (DUF336 family)/NAD-dependent dihydropyrimidine dehydrogenase PreA subunit
MPYVITERCTLDGSCVDVCPVACIHTQPGSSQYYIDPDVCIECEQCEIVCPVEAIFIDWKLPAELEPAIEVNASFFRKHKAVAGPVSVTKAFEMVRAALAHAERFGIVVTCAVVDEAGHPIALQRMEGAPGWTSELALSKAYTAASFRVATNLMRNEPRRPWFYSLVVSSRGRILAAGGGMPVASGTIVVGGIGVAGGTEEQDALCCRAGLAVLGEPAHH